MNEKNNGILILSNDYRLMNINDEGIIELDLGCGKGSFSCALAERFPDRTIIASDIMLGRLRRLRNKKERNRLDNMILLRVESRHLVALMLPDASIHRLHVLCPDPWPKERHSHKRLLCSDFVFQIHRVLAPSGIFHFATDNLEYFSETIAIIDSSGLFQKDDSAISDIQDIKTDFEKNWIAKGREVPHAAWRKKPISR